MAKVGRKKRKFTKDQKKRIEEAAFTGCHLETIAILTDIPETTLKRRFGPIIAKKRAERRDELRKAQNRLASDGNPTMLIFLGKNDLQQVDKHETKHSGSIDLAGALASLDRGEEKGKT